jgi:hypothetical protein
MAQRQRRDWRDSFSIMAHSGKSRLRGAAEPLAAACPGFVGGAGVGHFTERKTHCLKKDTTALTH